MNTLQLCIIYYTVAVSIDRYLYVASGLNISLYCTVRNALRIIIGLTIFAIIFILPHWFKFRVNKRIDTENRTHYKMSCKYKTSFFILIQLIILDTDIGQKKVFHEIVNLYTYIPIVHVIPFITLIFVNILTVRRLIEYHDEHRRLLTKSIRQMAMIKTNINYSRRYHHVTIMLIGVVLLFCLCRFPMLINQIYEIRESMSDDYLSKQNLYFQCRIQRIFNTFANFMQTINSNGNLIIYLLCYQNFRETSKELFENLFNCIRLQVNENILTIIHGRSRASTHATDA
jgi:hypothetical protein